MNIPKVEELLSSGANPNHRDAQGYTALMRAASSGNVELVKMLLAAGANPNLRNKNGMTAQTYGKFHPPVQKLLLAAGGRTDPKPTQPKRGEAGYCKAMYVRAYSLCRSDETSRKITAAQRWQTCNQSGKF